MSPDIDISPAHNNARLDGPGSRGYLDLGSGNATLSIYGSTRPSPGDAAGSDPLVVITLDKPCGTIVSDQLRLSMEELTGYMATNSGDAVWARLLNGNGDWAGDGDVSDAEEDPPGGFVLATGVHITAGGYVVLGTASLE